MEIVCGAKGCKWFQQGGFNNCQRRNDTSLDDYDIATVGQDGTCTNFAPKPEKE